MRRPCRHPKPIGCGVIIAGVLIILAMILPVGFWWFALATLLICCGIWLLRL